MNPSPDTQDTEELRKSIIHGLRMQGWSRIDAENEADERIAKLSQGSVDDLP